MTAAILMPASVDEAVELLDRQPGSRILAGGTDYMIEVNYGHTEPRSIVSLRAVDALRGWRREGDFIELGAGIRFADILDPQLAKLAPALAQAARTVGSPQIRNAATLGGNVATASPAGDSLPVLFALDAVVNIAGPKGRRSAPISQFITGVKRTTLTAGELIASITIPVASGPQEFIKVGRRNAMVIAIANLALIVDAGARKVACALGSVGPTIIRCGEAEALVSSQLNWERTRIDNPQLFDEFGALCAKSARPITDHRATADYRRHAIATLARRALMRAL